MAGKIIYGLRSCLLREICLGYLFVARRWISMVTLLLFRALDPSSRLLPGLGIKAADAWL